MTYRRSMFDHVDVVLCHFTLCVTKIVMVGMLSFQKLYEKFVTFRTAVNKLVRGTVFF
jgi:hypothetical protein